VSPRRCLTDGCRIPARRRGLCVIHLLQEPDHHQEPAHTYRCRKPGCAFESTKGLGGHHRVHQGDVIAWLDAGPLIEALNATGEPIVNLVSVADRRAFYRARKTGVVSDLIADRIAVQVLGRTLDEIYGPNWDEQGVPA
jgi:hypothetical protein